MRYWLIKSEPTTYSWDKLVQEGGTLWSGVRNFQARNNLKIMKKGDLLLFYHSVKEKMILGIAEVTKEYYQDPTSNDPAWVVVDIAPKKPLNIPVTLNDIKGERSLVAMALLKQSRLSVSPVHEDEFKKILALGETTL